MLLLRHGRRLTPASRPLRRLLSGAEDLEQSQQRQNLLQRPPSIRCLSSFQSPPSQSFLRDDPERRGTARIMDGLAAAAAWEQEMASEVRSRTESVDDVDVGVDGGKRPKPRRRPPSLAVVLVGDRPDSVLYVQRKLEAAARVGIQARAVRLPADSTEERVRAAVAEASAADDVDGVLVQLPLPRGISESAVLETLDPWKDVDGFHHVNLGRLAARGRAAAFVPAAALGVVELLRRCGAPLSSPSKGPGPSPALPAHALVLGDSTTVGVPLAMLLGREGVAATTLCHRPSTAALFEERDKEGGGGDGAAKRGEGEKDGRRAAAGACLPTLPGRRQVTAQDDEDDDDDSSGSDDDDSSGSDGDAASSANDDDNPLSSLAALVRSADIVVAALGSPEVVPGEWLKPGAWVVDVGINVLPVAEFEDAAEVKNADADVESDADVGKVKSSPALPDPTGTRGVDYRVVGDVHPSAFSVAAAISPVPGGVGPMTIAALLANTLRAARLGDRRKERERKEKARRREASSSEEKRDAA